MDIVCISVFTPDLVQALKIGRKFVPGDGQRCASFVIRRAFFQLRSTSWKRRRLRRFAITISISLKPLNFHFADLMSRNLGFFISDDSGFEM
jgi:hypothetical protein